MRFKDRKDAALTLIPFLTKYKNEKAIILAVPRGGVPIAYHIAKQLNLPVELLMTKKIGHPNNQELAIGAVSLEDHIIDENQRISTSYINERVKVIRKNLKERYRLFMGDRIPVKLKNKTIIIVDDGIATGNTILSSIEMLRKQQPHKIVVAVPVAPPEMAFKMKKEVDDFICPYLPEKFLGVGYHYQNFSEVKDEEVVRLLKEMNKNDPRNMNAEIYD